MNNNADKGKPQITPKFTREINVKSYKEFSRATIRTHLCVADQNGCRSATGGVLRDQDVLAAAAITTSEKIFRHTFRYVEIDAKVIRVNSDITIVK